MKKLIYLFQKTMFRIFRFTFYKDGIWFYYKGDEVLWVFPWVKPRGGNRFISLLFEANIGSLKELDNLWEDYNSMFEKKENDG